MKVKKELEGGVTFSKILNGNVKIIDKNVDLFLSEGRYDLLENTPTPKKLEPIKNNLEEKSVKELRELAKDLEGFDSKMKKQELIQLIQK